MACERLLVAEDRGHVTQNGKRRLLLLYYYYYYYYLLRFDLSLGGSSPYTSTDKTNKNKYTLTKQYEKTQYKQYKTQ
jgi:hypothetical protein